MGTDTAAYEAPPGPIERGVVVGLWIALLGLFALFTRESFVFGEGLWVFAVLLLCVVGSEWRWRSRFLRQVAPLVQFLISAVALFWVLSMFDTYAILRGTFPEGIEVTEIPDGVGGIVTLSPFMSGAWTMRRAVDQQLASACLPVFVLVAQVAASRIARIVTVELSSGAHGA